MATPKVLVIAGSDSSGGAGLEADQKVLAAHKVFAMTATTALTAQNTKGVQDVHVTPPEFVEKQIRAVLDDGFLQAADWQRTEEKREQGIVKIGMLASTDTITTVAKVLDEYVGETEEERRLKIVLDPVMVSTSGHQLLPGDAVSNLRRKLLPMTYVLTPNIPEALLLLREAHPDRETDFRSPTNLEDLKQLARSVQALGARHVLLKGGHMPLTKSYEKARTDDEKAITVDILYPSEEYSDSTDPHLKVIESPYLASPNTHGTGCSLASALAAQLALQERATVSEISLSHLTRKAVSYISHAIRISAAPHFSVAHTGAHGPINHFHSLGVAAFPPCTPSPILIDPSTSSSAGPLETYLLSHPSIGPLWRRFTVTHPFTTQLAQGTLPLATFRNYLIQDYLYLTHFARTYALAAYKSQRMSTITANAAIILHIEHEMKLHLKYCEEFGVTKQQIEATRESTATQAYARYLLDVGASGDLLGVYVALAPCLLGYAAVARRVFDDPGSVREGNRYWQWVENYVAEDYSEALDKGRKVLEREAERCGVAFARGSGEGKGEGGRLEELVEIFREATRLEVGFWGDDAHLPEEEYED